MVKKAKAVVTVESEVREAFGETESSPTETVTLASAKGSVQASGITLDLTTLSPASIAYLLSYGFAKSIQDAAAGLTAAASDAFKTGADTLDGMLKAMGTKGNDFVVPSDMTPEAFGKAYAQTKRLQRAEAIRLGTLGARATVATLDPIERLIQTIAKERLYGAFAAQGKKRPDGETLAKLIPLYRAKYGEAVRAEAEQRQAAASAVDLSDIF